MKNLFCPHCLNEKVNYLGIIDTYDDYLHIFCFACEKHFMEEDNGEKRKNNMSSLQQ